MPLRQPQVSLCWIHTAECVCVCVCVFLFFFKGDPKSIVVFPVVFLVTPQKRGALKTDTPKWTVSIACERVLRAWPNCLGDLLCQVSLLTLSAITAPPPPPFHPFPCRQPSPFNQPASNRTTPTTPPGNPPTNPLQASPAEQAHALMAEDCR